MFATGEQETAVETSRGSKKTSTFSKHKSRSLKKTRLEEASSARRPRSHVYSVETPPNAFDKIKVCVCGQVREWYPYRTTQQPLVSFLSTESRAARVAASKTSSTPSPVSELHSRYLRAPMISFMSLPFLGVVNLRDFLRISSWARGSSRRSFFRPTRMIGTPWHRSRASSAHLCLTFSSESGESTEKPMRRTWALL
jgi:hypothetical protein